MVGLKDIIKDDNERYKHILKNQIYICDISSKNMFLYLNIFDPNNEYKDIMNYHRGSFLPDENNNCEFDNLGWGKFDIIVGNPPFQEVDTNNKRKPGGTNLYMKFIKKSISLTPTKIYQIIHYNRCLFFFYYLSCLIMLLPFISILKG